MGLFKKFLKIPAGEKQIQAFESWVVRWDSYEIGYFSAVPRPEMEIFPTEEGAQDFANALKQAFRLIKSPSLDKVKVSKNTNTLYESTVK